MDRGMDGARKDEGRDGSRGREGMRLKWSGTACSMRTIG